MDKFEEDKVLREAYKTLFADSKYFADETLTQILKLRSYIDIVKLEDELLADTLTIAVLACLLPVSHLKKAGDVRFKTPKEQAARKILIGGSTKQLKEIKKQHQKRKSKINNSQTIKIKQK